MDDPPTPAKADATGRTDDDILDEARNRRRACVEAEGDNVNAAIADLKFLVGGENQWDELAVASRKMDGRPIITVNTLPTYLHQVTNDQRMNTPSIKVHPAGIGADAETALVRQGIIRHIEYDSNADVAYDTAVNSAAAIGFGFFRIITDWKTPTSSDQKIMFQRIRNAMSVKIDPLNVEPDGSGMKYCFIELKMSKDAFKREWPDATASTTTVFEGDTAYTDWLTETEVLVADYYCIETEKAEVVLLSNGESGYKDKLLEIPDGVTIEKTRPGERSKVMLYKISGTDILERTEIKCKWIPVFPVYGDELDIEGKIIRSGIVRHAKGPAQMYNVMMTSATEEVSLRAKAPYIMAEGQEEGHEDEWAQANNRAFPYLTYKPKTIDGQLAPPPQRNPMADVPAGMLAMAAHAADNIKKTTGLFDASLGARGNATSGIQERSQQQQGDMANFHYMDGLMRTIVHAGRCINCMIPNYLDTEQVVAIMGTDGTVSHTTINQPNPNPTPDPVTGAIKQVLNDMTCGEYTITVTAGPSYSTLRQEAAEGMSKVMTTNPQLWPVIGDLYVRGQDWPFADKIADRLEKTLAPNLKDTPKDGPPPDIQTPNGPLPVAEVPHVLEQLHGQLQQAQEALKTANADKQHAEMLRQQAEALKQQHLLNEQQMEPQKTQIERINADAALKSAEAAGVKAQADLVKANAEAAIAPTKAQTELVNAHAAAKVALTPEPAAEGAEDEPPSPTLDDIARLIQESRPVPPASMTIRAPSGQVYQVQMNQ